MKLKLTTHNCNSTVSLKIIRAWGKASDKINNDSGITWGHLMSRKMLAQICFWGRFFIFFNFGSWKALLNEQHFAYAKSINKPIWNEDYCCQSYQNRIKPVSVIDAKCNWNDKRKAFSTNSSLAFSHSFELLIFKETKFGSTRVSALKFIAKIL